MNVPIGYNIKSAYKIGIIEIQILIDSMIGIRQMHMHTHSLRSIQMIYFENLNWASGKSS